MRLTGKIILKHKSLIEVVERKGIGHPDTLSDAIAERASQLYCQYMLMHYGRAAHHWFDKVMLLGGEAKTEYGLGVMLRPYTVIFAGKVVQSVGNVAIPIDDILRKAATEILTKSLRGFDKERHLIIENRLWNATGPGQPRSRYRPNSVKDLPVRSSISVSNDCNLCCGFAPLTPLEQLVLLVERNLSNDPPPFSEIGTDIKVIGTRRSDLIDLLVNVPFLAAQIHSWDHYLQSLRKVKNHVLDISQRFRLRGIRQVRVSINPEHVHNRSYLTCLGSAADTGDIGAVGRGNRINGLITPSRPMSIEASNGKNPLDHTGKIYGILAHRLADQLFKIFNLPVSIFISTSKGAKLEKPDDVIVEFEGSGQDVPHGFKEIIKKQLTQIPELIDELINPGILQV